MVGGAKKTPLKAVGQQQSIFKDLPVFAYFYN
jgi:hypothetical protein